MKQTNDGNNLRGFYLMLAGLEGQRTAELVSVWHPSEVVRVTRAFRLAFNRSQFARHWFPVRRSISAPALGNLVAEAFIDRINRHLPRYVINDLTGNGYPDRLLLRLPSLLGCALEIKAASAWNVDNWQRIVLTSASGKLRRHFKRLRGSRVCHLLLTIFFSRQGDHARIYGLRLDFLQPTSCVQTRYEASMSQHMLAKGKHPVRFVRGRSPRKLARRGGVRPIRRSQRAVRRRRSRR
jgi:hypothetical protein